MFILALSLTLLMALVIYLDATRYTIPNWLNALVMALFPFVWLLSPEGVEWKESLMALAVAFPLGYFIFAMRWMGGGDSKLIMATSLWVGIYGMLDYVIYIALLGGLLSIVLLLSRRALFYMRDAQQLPELLRPKAPVPYGLAIATAFLWLLWTGKLAGLSTLPAGAML